jgi:uncharacterized protein YkwD
MRSPVPAAIRRARLSVEQLEVRQLLSVSVPSAVEQFFLEQLNDVRADPAAYGASIGVDLSTVAPSQPLAFNPELVSAAQQHSQDMNDRGYFAHDTPEGLDPGQRMTAAGFVWSGWGESIAGGTEFPGPSDALRGLIVDASVPDLGHRHHLLAMDPNFQNQNQVGIGIVQAGTGPLTDYYTIDTASTFSGGPILTGVVMTDFNGNGKYDIGEGMGGVTITVAGVGSITTWDSGGYSFALSPGTYTVTASGGGLAAPITRTVAVGTQNVRLNFSQGEDGFIRSLYQVILGRSAGDGEVAAWEAVMQGPSGPAAVVSGIQHSIEANTRLVDGWYVTYLGRQAVNGEEQGWVVALCQGVSEEQVLAGILGSQEFYRHTARLAPAGTSDQSYIESLYALLLHRTPSAGEMADWLPALAAAGRDAVAASFLHSAEFRAGMIAGYYQNVLNRPAPASAAEVFGWVDSGLDLMSIHMAFEESQEFFLDG